MRAVLLSSCLLVAAGICLQGGNCSPLDGEDAVPDRMVKQCTPSPTTVNGKPACSKDLIFEDDFKSGIDESKWRKDLLIAGSPDFEFVLYNNGPLNSFVEKEVLHLKPVLVSNANDFSLKGQVDHRKSGCTGVTQDECFQQASGFNILSPVTAGRIKTSQNFSFKYGTVEIRAKFPEGNWLYPELWLEPLERFYGPEYASGRMWVGMARGNAELLKTDGEDVGAKLLQGGVILSAEQNRYYGVKEKRAMAGWHADFHNYRLKWAPEGVIMSVDGDVYGAVQPPMLGGFSFVEGNERWKEGTNMAPFDREFYVTLGVGVGGIRDFPDNSTTGGMHKPWKNKGAKAKLDFLMASKNWKDSWAWEEAALQVDYVKVWAL